MIHDFNIYMYNKYGIIWVFTPSLITGNWPLIPNLQLVSIPHKENYLSKYGWVLLDSKPLLKYNLHNGIMLKDLKKVQS